MSDPARMALWLEALQSQSQGMLLAAVVGLVAVFGGLAVVEVWPRAGRWLPWLGVGGFYASLAFLWLAFH